MVQPCPDLKGTFSMRFIQNSASHKAPSLSLFFFPFQMCGWFLSCVILIAHFKGTQQKAISGSLIEHWGDISRKKVFQGLFWMSKKKKRTLSPPPDSNKNYSKNCGLSLPRLLILKVSCLLNHLTFRISNAAPIHADALQILLYLALSFHETVFGFNLTQFQHVSLCGCDIIKLQFNECVYVILHLKPYPCSVVGTSQSDPAYTFHCCSGLHSSGVQKNTNWAVHSGQRGPEASPLSFQ